MIDLKDALDVLHELHELRTRAKELREQGRTALNQIKVLDNAPPAGVPLTEEEQQALDRFRRDHWISSGNNVEVGLLVKVQDHKDLSEEDAENDCAEASPRLRNALLAVDLQNLFPRMDTEIADGDEERGDRRLPVLVAARTMQALVGRSKTVFSKATLHCYYRIVRELYLAAPPDWTMGAARAGQNGTTSAFVTGECIRAVFGFENAIRRTASFLRQTHRLLGRYELLKEMARVFDVPKQNGAERLSNANRRPVSVDAKHQNSMDLWADRAIERMWFDWHISTNARDGNIGLDLHDDFFANTSQRVDMQLVGQYLAGLTARLESAVKRAREQIDQAHKNVLDFREQQAKYLLEQSTGAGTNKTRTELHNDEKRARDFDRAESAHKFAASLIAKAANEAKVAAEFIRKAKRGEKPLEKILEELEKQFSRMADDIHRVLEPSRRYIRTVLHREVASTAFGRFDAGELVFAAASYGAITDWKSSELLSRACDLLVDALPENGRLPTTRPFHSTLKGHRMLPIGCEMTRSLAQLLQRNAYEFEPKLVRRMLNIFEEKMIHLEPLGQNARIKRVGWNFDGSPHPNRPCVWVTAVSVLAIDRIVRMLNERINSIVFKYFEVIRPEKPHSLLTLNDLIYSDFGFSEYYHPSQRSIGLRLEQMRGHVMRVTLPDIYKDQKGQKERVFSAIFYGPPGTGKTTLVEALALSSNVPLIRLSPSDLVVQGPAAIEGRARYVFEALSMLTQVVIILDEFEEVIGKRTPTGAENREKIFDFLRTGMLPKLIKLNDAARKQSFVYCLATNYLERIEPAAMRHGRFDFKLPVYDPDALSRAGTLLYRLCRVVQKLEELKQLPARNGAMPRQFLAVVEKTRNTRASSFAQDYLRLPGWVVEKDSKCPEGDLAQEIPLFWYVLTGKNVGYSEKIKLAIDEGLRSDQEQIKFYKECATPDEKDESDWLQRYEAQLTQLSKRRAFTLNDVWLSLAEPTKSAGKRKASRSN
jgi:hypothetical protein